MLKSERLSRLSTNPLTASNIHIPTTRVQDRMAGRGKALEDGNNLHRCATLARFCAGRRIHGTWRPSAVFADRNVTNVFNRRCMHAKLLITGQSSTKPSLPRLALEHKALHPRDKTIVHFVRTHIRVPSRVAMRVGFELTYLRDARARHPDDSSRKRHGPYGS
jgi:hypothetical protein